MSDLGRRLRQLPLPGEAAARERARRTVLAAHAAQPLRRRRRNAAPALLALAAVLAGGAFTRPGQAVVGGPARAVRALVRDAVGPAPTPRPLPAHAAILPIGGRLLAAGPHGTWIVDSGGARRLGPWTAATWSPQGVFVGVAAGRTLAAVDPQGGVHWRLLRPAAVSAPRWSPDGTHVAYRSGRELRVVYGNGTHDTLLAADAAPVAPAWRPHSPHALAWASRGGVVRVTDADTGGTLWRARGGHVTLLAWSADGRRLLIAGPHAGRVHDLAAQSSRRLRMPLDSRLVAAAFSPSGELALATERDGRGQISLHRRTLFSAPGRLAGLVWSPDGRWLATDWRAAGEWLLVRAHGRPRVEIVATSARRAAVPQGWVAFSPCCR